MKRKTPLRAKTGFLKKKKVHNPLKPRIVTYSAARNRVAKVFQLFIRLRDSVKTTSTIGYCRCITCPRTYPSTGKGCIQAGHFIPGRRNALIFDERNCHGQCYNCNMNLRGNWVIYRQNMVQMYGEDTVKELESLNNVVRQFTVPELLAMEQEYLQKVKDLQMQFGESTV